MSAKVFLTGRIANELKIKKIKENKVMEFNLACRDGKNTEFIPCTVWNSQAEMIEKYCTKGSMLEISGRLRTSEYIVNNTRHKSWTVLVESFEFIGKNEKKTEQVQMELLNEKEGEVSYEQDFR